MNIFIKPAIVKPVKPVRQESLREHNLGVVARAVVDATEPLSRAGVASLTGMTRATVSSLVDRLIAAGIVAEIDPLAPVGAGRPGVPLVPARRTIVGLGLEVNVDYIGIRVVDLAGDPIEQTVEPGDFHGSDPAETLARIGRLAGEAIERTKAAGMRVAGARLALPGLVDVATSRLRIAPNLGWSELDPIPLAGLPAGLPVAVANEAKLAALAQVWAAGTRGRTERSFLYVSGDVGVGAAIVMDGRLFVGSHGWSGEIGHQVVDPSGPRCRCGASGCLESYAGKEALMRPLGLGLDAPDTLVVERLAAGGEVARDAVATAGVALGRAIANAVNLVDVEQVLLGGLYAPLVSYLRPMIESELSERVLAAPWASTAVEAAPVGDHAALTGGALAVLRDLLDAPGRAA